MRGCGTNLSKYTSRGMAGRGRAARIPHRVHSARPSESLGVRFVASRCMQEYVRVPDRQSIEQAVAIADDYFTSGYT